MIKKLANVKSIITLSMVIVFCYLCIVGKISNNEFMTAFIMILTYYFTRKATEGEKENEPSNK